MSNSGKGQTHPIQGKEGRIKERESGGDLLKDEGECLVNGWFSVPSPVDSIKSSCQRP